MSKPPYAVPAMADIAALPWNGFNVVSTFSGCGGSSLGYRIAGFRVLWANEFIEAARDTYKANAAPYTIVDGRDIRTVQPESILAATGLRPGELDLLDGSPPCCSFSMAGKRAKGWGEQRAYSDGVQQRTDDLFFQYTRLLRGLRPKCFVAENVAGLVRGVAKGYFLDILKELKACSYRVAARVLDGQWLGVPQARQRLIFVGVRDDLGLEPAHPKPLPYRYTLRDVLVPGGPAEPDTDISRFAIGREWDRMGKPGTQSEKYFQLVRPALDASCPTVTATTGQPGAAGVCHPTERRKFSIAELRRICSFPHDFVLTGTYQQQVERMGRAVPPIMMAAIAAAVRDNVLRRINP